MNLTVKTLLALATTAVAWPAAAQLTLYEHDGFTGRSWRTSAAVRNLDNRGFNDRASSVLVARGRWEVCENNNFSGRCRVLRAGRYPSLSDMGLNDRVSSVRAVGTRQWVQDERYAPLPVVQQDFRRRDGERLYQARVSSAHAVMGPPEQRCWVERTQVQGQRSSNLPGAVAGALIGGILGHQIGGGTGRDIATVGGVVAGAAVGSRVGGGGSSQPQDVQRCTSVRGDARIDHWDVGYTYRGMAHQVQMAGDPGRTVTVNRYGEPRE